MSARFYGRGEGAVVALDGVSAALSPGSFTAIMGPSGSGKSTFLNVAAGWTGPPQEASRSAAADLAQLSERRLTILRRERIGFVFQAFNLLPSLTVAQNIRPAAAAGRPPAATLGRA
jgi:ABC-type antimicrobial peptide transport system, ATPase component